MSAYKTELYDLSECFHRAKEAGSNVLRIPSMEKSTLFHSITRLEQSFSDNAYAANLYRQILFLEFMIHLNRATIKNRLEYLSTDNCNSKVIDILHYINENLTSELSIDHIAETFYLSKYYMMRLFKQETGYTIGNYISSKRLLLAKELIISGMPAAEACYTCGYQDYSNFSRAYKSLFGESVRDTRTFS